jgi:hypothetical protein
LSRCGVRRSTSDIQYSVDDLLPVRQNTWCASLLAANCGGASPKTVEPAS